MININISQSLMFYPSFPSFLHQSFTSLRSCSNDFSIAANFSSASHQKNRGEMRLLFQYCGNIVDLLEDLWILELL